MYYHLYVEYLFGEGSKAKKEEAYIQDETDLEKIKSSYVKPFINGSPMFIVSGRVVRCGTVNIFRILESEIPLSDVIAAKNARTPRGLIMVFGACDLLAANDPNLKDITNDVIALI